MQNLIVRLTGGLGNQLFQYAFSKALESRAAEPVALDISDYETSSRKFGLDNFKCELLLSDKSDKSRLKTPHFKLKKQLKKIFGIGYNIAPTHYVEGRFEFDEEALKIKSPRYIEGLFQTEKYFASIADSLREQLEFKDADKFKNSANFDAVSNANSVAVHVRCGDYVSRAKTRKILDVCTADYYKRAVGHMEKNLQNPEFFLFSDDLKMTLERFPFMKDFKAVNSSGDIEDMFLMSHCKNNIIANSTFSWWAAWLNKSEKKIVVLPERWFAGCANINYSDIPAKGWIKIPVD